ncbi:aminotransferase class V-fold PLP-dependent enzyme [Intestinimonas sp.]|uniref:aminotransferase class V-fold PLP-dependent enzyme n=1 Tax=Intestinimonas sp. TaxID=1965293 RepID=UPI003AAD9523
MKRTYQFDQAATSFPKAEGVAEAMMEYLTQVGGNVGRGAYPSACDAAEAVLEVRERLCTLLGGPAPQNVILTPGCTYSLNFVLKGLLRPGDRVAVSGLEHNAVLRPLRQMEARGVTVDCLPCRATGELDLAAAERRLTPDTRLVVLTHASNVCGTLLPVAEVGALCRERGIFLCVDAAQTAGSVPIHMEKMHIDALAFPGHKGLLGPQGIGGLIVTDALARALDPLVTGGTGSASDSPEMPELLPDRFEPGTLNLPGVYGLRAALRWLEGQDLEVLRRREIKLTGHLIARLREMEEDGLKIFGTLDAARQVGVVSVDFPGLDNAEAAFQLERDYGVLTRCGLHCAPLAHRTLGTFPAGTVRFSVGPFTRFEDVDYLQAAVCGVMGV